jgi:tetratricopeptide (TPR) repeat protein
MQMGDSMRLAFQDWLEATTREQQVVFVLEDLQWGDAATLDYLSAAMTVLRERPLLVLGIGRSEVRDAFPALASRGDVQEIRVGPLGRKAAQKMVALALGDAVSADKVDAWIERVDGNAFHLEELLRAVHAGRGDALPESVLGMVQSRLDALSAGARRALRVGSVYGQTFWRGSVRALVGDEHASEIGPWLDELVQREVVSRKTASAIAGEEEFTIRGTLLHDAAYATVPDADRTRAHALAGTWLEASGFRNAATLAEHFERGEDAARAYRWLRRAAEESMEANDYGATISRAERAMRYTSARTERGELRVLQAEANRWRGRLDECGRCAVEAMQLLAEGSPRWFRALGEAGVVAGRTGQMDHAVDLAKQWFDAEEQSGPSIDAVSSATRLAVQLLLGGRLEAGHALADAIENSVAAFPEIGPLGEGRVAQCRAKRALLTRDLEGYLRNSQRAVESFERGGDERNAAVERLNAAHAMLQLGLYGESETTVKQVLGTVSRLGMVSMGMGARHHLARAIAHRGDFAQARVYETEVVAWFAKQGDPRMTGMCMAVFAEILLDAGDHAEALATATRAAEIAAPVPAALARALGALALAQFANGDAKAACETARRGVALVDRIGSIEEGEGQLRYSQSAALLALGDRDGARAAIANARKVLLAHADRVATTEYRERFLRDVPVHARILALAEELNPA